MKLSEYQDKLTQALREAQIMFPDCPEEKIRSACIHFVECEFGGMMKDLEILKDKTINIIFNRLLFGSRMED